MACLRQKSAKCILTQFFKKRWEIIVQKWAVGRNPTEMSAFVDERSEEIGFICNVHFAHLANTHYIKMVHCSKWCVVFALSLL